MFGEEKIRTLMGPADPASGRDVRYTTVTVADLIARAEATTVRTGAGAARPRRFVLVAGVATAVSAAAAVPFVVRGQSTPEPEQLGAEPGTVLAPIAYQIDTSPPLAGPELRALADRIVDAPSDRSTGRYVYHRVRTWGAAIVTSPEGREISYTEEREEWIGPDGSIRQRQFQLPPEFPDEASRRYWAEHHSTPLPGATTSGPVDDIPPHPDRPTNSVPTDRVVFVRGIVGGGRPADVAKKLHGVSTWYLLDRQTRADILRGLAGVRGFVWRGRVTDRAGRSGVAITADDTVNKSQSVLVFDPRTGELLAHEMVNLTHGRVVEFYSLILKHDRTDQPG
jgi:hypothetical protein